MKMKEFKNVLFLNIYVFNFTENKCLHVTNHQSLYILNFMCVMYIFFVHDNRVLKLLSDTFLLDLINSVLKILFK